MVIYWLMSFVDLICTILCMEDEKECKELLS